jgi:hypothetical protein
VEQRIQIVFPDEDGAKRAAGLYAADGFEVKDICPAADGTGWALEAFRRDVEGDGLWTAGRLTAFRSTR